MRLIGPPWRRPRSRYEFGDLVTVKRLAALLNQGVPLHRIRRSLETLRERLPEVEQPLGALRLWDEGSGRMVVRHGDVLLEPGGQLVLDLGEEEGGPGAVASLDPDVSGSRELQQARAREEAQAWFDRGCKLDMDRATWADAIDAYQRAIQADPECADAHCNLGTVLYNQNRKAAARDCFQRAIGIEPHHVEAHLNLATLCEEENRNETALRHYKLALESDPLCADGHVSLALLYQKLELPRSSRDHWRRYLQLDPEGTWADVARRHLDD